MIWASRFKLTFYGYVCAAAWASHVFCQVPLRDLETEPFDKQLVAVGAIGVFVWMSWHVSNVNVV